MNTKIANCNTELLEKQKNDLKNDIIYNNNSRGFIVYDIEAGCRKTRTAEEALAELALNTDKQAIFVRLNNSDCRESVENINKIANANIAFAFNNEDIPTQGERIKISKDLSRYPIIVITHAKYKVLAQNTSMQKLFTKGRCVLVMDEFASVRETIKISLPILSTFKLLFQCDMVIYQEFSKLISNLEDKLIASISDNERHFIRIENGYVGKEFNEIVKLIKSNFSDESLKRRIERISYNNENIDYNFLSVEVSSVKKLCEWMLNIKEFYKAVCIISNGDAYINNSRYKHWMLDTNIILDANGELQAAYELNSKLYHLKKCGPVLNHKKWTIINIPINTTTSGKESMEQYYEFIKNQLNKYEQNILVVCKKEEVDLLNNDFQQIGYFGNIIGSNQWADVKNVAIIHTPNLNDFEYILTYLYYNKDYIENNITLTAHRRGRKMVTQYQFDDPRFERIRTQWITTEIYQAVKRVNRNMIYDTDCMIFINNDSVIDLLRSKLIGCTVKQKDATASDVGYVTTKQDKYVETLIDNSYASRFIQLLAELQQGKHEELSHSKGIFKKKTIREYLGINSAVSFSNHVLNKSNVIEYCTTRNINISGQTIKLVV